jgi:hypothetical protein
VQQLEVRVRVFVPIAPVAVGIAGTAQAVVWRRVPAAPVVPTGFNKGAFRFACARLRQHGKVTVCAFVQTADAGGE